VKERHGVQLEEAGHGDGGRVQDVACGRVDKGISAAYRVVCREERARRTPERMARHEADLDGVGPDLAADAAVLPACVRLDGRGRGRRAEVGWFLSSIKGLQRCFGQRKGGREEREERTSKTAPKPSSSDAVLGEEARDMLLRADLGEASV